jgi:hypothetical protein
MKNRHDRRALMSITRRASRAVQKVRKLSGPCPAFDRLSKHASALWASAVKQGLTSSAD